MGVCKVGTLHSPVLGHWTQHPHSNVPRGSSLWRESTFLKTADAFPLHSSCRDITATTHFHVVSWLRICKVIRPLPHAFKTWFLIIAGVMFSTFLEWWKHESKEKQSEDLHLSRANVTVSSLLLLVQCCIFQRTRSTVVKVLCYKSEGRWFDSRWCHWNFSLT
jgi:hypothetical protein